LPRSPVSYEVPCTAPKPGFRFPWTLADRTTSSCQLHPLRSLAPLASPFTTPRVAPRRRPMLSWAFAPLKSPPPTPGVLEPTRARAPEHATRPEALAPRVRDLSTPASGGPTNEQECPAVNPSTDSSPLRGWPEPPLGGSPPPMALDGGRTRNPDLRSLAVREKRLSSAEVSTPMGFLASSSTS